jgi:hypothetical protein
MLWAGALRWELSARNQQIAVMNGSVHELTAGETPSVCALEVPRCGSEQSLGRRTPN